MRPTIHFADSDHELCACYMVLSRARGWRTTTSHDCPINSDPLENRFPDVLVVDTGLLRGKSRRVLAELGQRFDGWHTVPVFVTGPESLDQLAKLTGVPVTRCFQKPFSVNVLLDAIGAQLAGPLPETSHPWKFTADAGDQPITDIRPGVLS